MKQSFPNDENFMKSNIISTFRSFSNIYIFFSIKVRLTHFLTIYFYLVFILFRLIHRPQKNYGKKVAAYPIWNCHHCSYMVATSKFGVIRHGQHKVKRFWHHHDAIHTIQIRVLAFLGMVAIYFFLFLAKNKNKILIKLANWSERAAKSVKCLKFCQLNYTIANNEHNAKNVGHQLMSANCINLYAA